jgi:TetR/AcrR family transcriptional regulator
MTRDADIDPHDRSPVREQADIRPRPRRAGGEDLRTAILRVATDEFARHGFNGVRIERIASHAECSVRMLYKYYGDKRALYLRVLEDAYAELRRHDLQMTEGVAPLRAIEALIEGTFDYMQRNREFALLTRNENLLEGRFVSLSRRSAASAAALIRSLRRILRDGERSGTFRPGIDALQLYVSIVALSVHHIVNEHTLSTVFGERLGHDTWIAARRRHVRQLILGGILSDPSGAQGAFPG